MLTKDDLLEAIQLECDICIHLHGKLPEGGLEYRPSPAQRTTAELLRYLSYHALGFATALVDGEWDTYKRLAEKAADLHPDGFPEAMRAQKDELGAIFARLSEDDLRDRTCVMPWGNEVPLGKGLLMLVQRCLCGYRMQLFLYAKAAGNHALGTPNCWIGVDMEPPA